MFEISLIKGLLFLRLFAVWLILPAFGILGGARYSIHRKGFSLDTQKVGVVQDVFFALLLRRKNCCTPRARKNMILSEPIKRIKKKKGGFHNLLHTFTLQRMDNGYITAHFWNTKLPQASQWRFLGIFLEMFGFSILQAF